MADAFQCMPMENSLQMMLLFHRALPSPQRVCLHSRPGLQLGGTHQTLPGTSPLLLRVLVVLMPGRGKGVLMVWWGSWSCRISTTQVSNVLLRPLVLKASWEVVKSWDEPTEKAGSGKELENRVE